MRLGVFNAAVAIGARFSTINGENSINFIVTAADTPGGPGGGIPLLPADGGDGGDHRQRVHRADSAHHRHSRPHQRPDYGHSGAGDDTETDESFRERIVEGPE